MIPFISICIPSYNRPQELKRLLQSIDTKKETIEIVIREDQAPKRGEVRAVVEEYKQTTNHLVNYIENEDNFGYDKNIRQTAKSATGEWIIFMGDDDVFIPGALDKYADFLRNYSESGGYVLRRYRANYANGTSEDFRYDNQNAFLPAGEASYIEFFRRSVFISGFTFKKEFFDEYDCADYDGTLLFQLYIQAQICLKHPCAYCDILITQSYEGGTPYFGNSQAEKKLYQPGQITYDNSINFLKQVVVMAEGIDRKNEIHCREAIINTYSKYSYGYLHEHRDDGIRIYRAYAKELKRIGFGSSPYFYVFYYALLIFGKRGTRSIIRIIKQILGKTPKL